MEVKNILDYLLIIKKMSELTTKNKTFLATFFLPGL